MFKSEANLFLSANNNVNYAKTLINECKRFINDYEPQSNSNFNNCKKSINDCNIDTLVDRIETTKESLLNLDKEFAETYMNALVESLSTSTISYENMSAEERLEYSLIVRDYDYSLLYMLEKYEETGMLTDEMKEQLKIQRIKIKQYELNDDMAILSTTSKEYINKFKQNAELDRELIKSLYTGDELQQKLKEYEIDFNSKLDVLNLNYNISVKSDELKNLEVGSEEYYKKENEIRQLQINYYNNKGNLTEEEKKFVQFQKDYIQVNNYYIAGDEDKARTKKTKMFDPVTGECVATADEIAYENADWWGRTWMNTKTVLATAVTALGGVGETIIDGAATLIGGTIGLANDDVAKWTEEFVSANWSDDAYDRMVLNGGLNSYSAYSDYHTVTDFATTAVTYIGLSCIPGLGGSAVMALSAAGSTSQTALNSGATLKEAVGASWTAGALAFAADFGLDKLNAAQGIAKGLKVAGRTAIGMGEPLVNTVTEYAIYGHENSSSIFDYAEKTGAYWNIGIGGTVANAASLVGGTVGHFKGKKVDAIANIESTNKVELQAETYSQKINSITDYEVNYKKEYKIANSLRSQGYNDMQIATHFAAKATQCANIKVKNKLYSLAYEYLKATSESPNNAKDIVMSVFDQQLINRGMTTVSVDSNGIKYNAINGINWDNQPYSIEYVKNIINELPEHIRKNISEINFYDTNSPVDIYWKEKYNNPYHVSAATGGGADRSIKIWSNNSISSHVIFHETGHCVDVGLNGNIGKYSSTAEYKAAIEADYKLNGAKSITTYGGNNLGEDFAETLSAYKNGYIMDGNKIVSIDDFPNRKAYFDKLFSEQDIEINANPTNIDLTSKLAVGSLSQVELLQTGKGVDNIPNNTTMYSYKKNGDKLPQWTSKESLSRGEEALSIFESINGSTKSEMEGLWTDILSKDYNYDLTSPEGISVVNSINKYYDNRLYQGIGNNIYDDIKDGISESSDLKIFSYKMNSDGTMSVDYSIDGVKQEPKTYSEKELSEIFKKTYEKARQDTMDIILHYEEDIPNVGTSRAYKYESLVKYNSAEDVVKHMSEQDIIEYESVWKEKVSIDGTNDEYNYGFFTTEEMIIEKAGDGHVIGYLNDDGSRTQWAMSLSSLKQNLSQMKFEGNKLTIDSIKNMSDVEIQYLAEDLIAVPRGSYDKKKLVFVAGDENINITNMTSNSLRGANDYYTVYGRTAGNVFEADVGAVDLYNSNTTKKSIDGIREMFITLLK